MHSSEIFFAKKKLLKSSAGGGGGKNRINSSSSSAGVAVSCEEVNKSTVISITGADVDDGKTLQDYYPSYENDEKNGALLSLLLLILFMKRLEEKRSRSDREDDTLKF